MLTQIKLTNFKCFKEQTTIPLSKFNLFTGINGTGKSTALQSLLLMRQSVENNPYTSELILNGSCVSLGCLDDVRNREVSKENPVFFELLYSDEQNKFSFHYYLQPKLDEMSLSILQVVMNIQYHSNIGGSIVTETVCNKLSYDDETGLYCLTGGDPDQHGYRLCLNMPSLFEFSQLIGTTEEAVYLMYSNFNFDIKNIHFISADRIGPQDVYLKSPLFGFRHVGTKGEFTVNLLDKLADESVTDELCLGNDAKTLITQTQAWLGEILTPLKLEVPRSKTNILELFLGDSKPANVGFGYSSILPIIVTGLIAKPGDKIIIENPEIHLHPKAQSALINFLVKVANTGVQIFIESHSDHILNALRLATKNKILMPEDVNILFFEQENKHSNIITPKIDQDGRIDQWPVDFFDETAKSLAGLAVGQRPRIKAPKA